MKVWQVIVLFLVLTAIIGAAFAGLFWLAWSKVAVEVFHWPALTFWQAWLLMTMLGLIGGMFRSSVEVKR